MRRLWVQLSVAFSAVVLISAGLIFIITVTYAERQRQAFSDDLRASVEEDMIYGEHGIIPQLEAHFAGEGTVNDAADLLAEFERSQQPQPFRVALQLVTRDGIVIAGRIPPEADYEQVVLDQVILRYEIRLPPPTAPPTTPGIPRPEDTLVLLVVTGTLTGIAVGVMMSRRLAAPLSQLAQTARQVGRRDFSLRVQPKGTDEMRDVANAFNEMAAMLEESEALRGNLVADVAHELRTPLTVMESSLRALIDDVYPLSKTEVLTLYDQTRHLSRMVQDLHELALADARELKFECEPFALNELLRSLSEIFKPVAELENVHFVVETPSAPLYVSGDRVRLGQVIQNLLVNALRHTPAHGEITLHAERQGSEVAIAVTDTGEGIPEEHLAHIFERFYRADRARDRSRGGVGLGLAIGKAIIEAQGGRITVTSRTQQPTGTRFTIYLPPGKDSGSS